MAKQRQRHKSQLSLFEPITIDLGAAKNLVPGSSVLSDLQVKDHRRESLALRGKLLSDDRKKRYHHGDYFGNEAAEERRRESVQRIIESNAHVSNPSMQRKFFADQLRGSEGGLAKPPQRQLSVHYGSLEVFDRLSAKVLSPSSPTNIWLGDNSKEK